MKIKIVIGLLLAGTVLLSCSKKGCTDDRAINYSPDAKKDDGTCILAGCTDPDADNYASWAVEDNGSCTYPVPDSTGALQIAVKFEVNGQELTYNQTYQTADQQYVSFSRVQFYLSGMDGIADSGFTPTQDLSDVYLLVSATEATQTIGQLDTGSYSGFKMAFGVDSMTNNTKQPVDFASGHALGVQDPSMHWGWQALYQFIKLEGSFDSDGDQVPDKTFEYHIGADKYYQEFNFSNKPFTISVGNTSIVNVTVDCGEFFKGLDMNANPTAHSTNTVSNTIMANTVNAFK